MNELKPCPFCGEKPVLKTEYVGISKYVYYECGKGDCGVRLPGISVSEHYCANDRAKEAWNRRAEQGQTAKAAENEALLNRYAAAARTIALYLDEFCDTGKPYDEMIACAARSAAEDLERVKQELDAAVKCLCASCKKISLSGNMITCCEMCHWHSAKEG